MKAFNPSDINQDFIITDGTFTATFPNTFVIGANPNRVYLGMWLSTGPTAWVHPRPGNSSGTFGMLLSTTLGPLILTIGDVGALVGFSFIIEPPGGIVSGYFVEVAYQPRR